MLTNNKKPQKLLTIQIVTKPKKTAKPSTHPKPKLQRPKTKTKEPVKAAHHQPNLQQFHKLKKPEHTSLKPNQ